MCFGRRWRGRRGCGLERGAEALVGWLEGMVGGLMQDWILLLFGWMDGV